MNYRKHIIDELVPYAEKDGRIVLLVCDMGFGVCDVFAEKFPHRIFNVGIMEQATVGIASGMAMTGLVPVVYSIVNFLAFRAIEQIRNDVLCQDLNVKFIGTGAENYFEFLGHSHCCGKDDIAIMKLIGIDVFDPFEQKKEFTELVSDWMNSKKAGYIRV